MTNYFEKKQKYFCKYKNVLYICDVIRQTDCTGLQIKNKGKMKITEEFLKSQGLTKLGNGAFVKRNNNPVWTIDIRKTAGDDSWQLSVFVCSTKTFDTYEGAKIPDNDIMQVNVCVTETEQYELALKLCGISQKKNWRNELPFFMIQGQPHKVYQMYEGEAVFTGFESPDYNTAMAEVKRRNKEFITKIEE